MTRTFDAFEVSPVPAPGPDAEPPELFRGIYGMPMFATLPTADLTTSADFWCRGLGFFELFSIPGQLIHLRRWMFQDVLLLAEAENAEGPAGVAPALTAGPSAGSPPASLSFACVESQLEGIAVACRELASGSVTGPQRRPWNSVDLEILTPEGARVVMTAAIPHDPAGPEAAFLREIGITGPGDA